MPNFTAGPWNVHPYYKKDLNIRRFDATEDHGAFERLEFTIAQGEKVLGEFRYHKSDGRTGWPSVDDMEEARANVVLVTRAPDFYALAAKLAQFDIPGVPDQIRALASDAADLVAAVDDPSVFFNRLAEVEEVK